MLLDLDKTKIALDNTTNQLMSLQHSQFVENRVYDDDETLANVENVPVESAKTETEVLNCKLFYIEYKKIILIYPSIAFFAFHRFHLITSCC